MIGLKIFTVCIGIYVGVRLSGIAIEWLREAFEYIRPRSKDRR